MKGFFLAVIPTVMLLGAVGCAGEGGQTRLAVSGVVGPETVKEGSAAQYSVFATAMGSAAVACQWAVDPSDAGSFSPKDKSTTTFTAGYFEADTPAEIVVTVTSAACEPEVRFVTIRIVDVTSDNPPLAAAHADPTELDAGGKVQFYDDSTDPDGNTDIVKWEWDFSYDAVAGFNTESQDREPIVQFAEPGTFSVQLRVTDSGGLRDTLDTPLTIVVHQGVSPVARAAAYPLRQIVDEPITFRDDGSYDPDGGVIMRYEWDWDNDGIFDEQGSEVSHAWGLVGVYEVQMRVTDDEWSRAVLEEPLEIVVCDLKQDWGVSWGESGEDSFMDIAVDKEGNIFAVGKHPGAFLSKFDSAGEFQWIRTWGDSDDDYSSAVVVDAEGNAYATGFYAWPAYGTGGAILNSYSASGDLRWVRSWGEIYANYGRDMAISPTGDLWITGYFSGSTDFDPSASHHNHKSNGENDIFLTRFNTAGGFIQARTWGGPYTDQGEGVAVDGAGNVYVTGSFKGDADFNPPAGIEDWHHAGSDDQPDAFLTCFNSSFEYQWTKTWCGDANCQLNPYALATDTGGNLYVTGRFSGTGDLDPGPGTDVHSAKGSDAFLSAFGPSGEFKWALTWGGEYHDEANDIAVDSLDNLYIAGAFQGNPDMDPGDGVLMLSASDSVDSFLSMFDASGSFFWALGWGGPDFDRANAVALGSSEDIYSAGLYWSTADLDPTNGIDEHTSSGSSDAYLIKLHQETD